MKKSFSVDRARFGKAVQWVSKWVPARPSVPVWAGILMQAEPGRLTLCGYNEDVSARTIIIDVDGDATGTALVSGKLLAALVATFPAGKPVEAEADDNLLTLRTGRVKVTLPLMGATDFPTLPVTPPTVATVAGDALAEAISRVAPAAAKEPSQTAWTPVWLGVASGRLEVLASDTRRVAQAFVDVESTADAEALAPSWVVSEAVKMMTSADKVELGVSENLVSFSTPTQILTVRQNAGPYKTTAVRKVIAPEMPVTALVSVSDLMPAVKRATLMKAEGHPTILDWSENELAVSAKGGDQGSEAAETIDAEYDGPDCRIAVNPSYLTDGVDAVRGDTVRIGFDPERPDKRLLITDPEDADFRHVMVPIKLDRVAT